MGKDDDKTAGNHRGSVSSAREDLKDQHIGLVRREQELAEHNQEIKVIFEKLEEAYLTSKGTFSVNRYGQLKDMIKGATSDQILSNLKKVVDGSGSNGDAGKSGLASLVQKAKEFSCDATQTNEVAEAAAPAKSSGKMFGFVKKLKNITGFSDDPITDEDVMSNSDLQRDNSRRQRYIQHLTGQFTHAVNKLEKLKHSYEASKSHAPPKRYQELKDMIKETVAKQ